MTEDDVKVVVDLWLAGHLPADAAMRAVAITVGRAERSEDSLYLGYLISQAASGRPGTIDTLVSEASR